MATGDSLLDSGGYVSVKVGNAADRNPLTWRSTTAELLAFIGATQGEEWEKVHMSHSSPDEAQRAFAQRDYAIAEMIAQGRL